MKFIVGLLLLIPSLCLAQPANQNLVLVSSAPSGSCSAGVAAQLQMTTGVIYTCQSGTWGTAGPGASGPPTGSAGGALTGSYPNPGLAACTVTGTLPCVVATVPLATYTGNITCTTFYTPAVDGIYRINISAYTTVAATSGSGNGQLSIFYTQPNGGAGVNHQPSIGAPFNLASITSASTADLSNGSLAVGDFRAKGGTPIQYCESGGGTAAGYTYAAAWYLEYLGS